MAASPDCLAVFSYLFCIIRLMGAVGKPSLNEASLSSRKRLFHVPSIKIAYEVYSIFVCFFLNFGVACKGRDLHED